MPLDALRVLQKDLTLREETNYETRKFVPAQWLDDLLTEQRVKKVVYESSKLRPETKDDVVSTTIAGARRIFATLVSLDHLHHFEHFIRYDEFQNRNLDQKLPMEISKLEKAFGSEKLKEELTTLSELGDNVSEGQIQRKDELEMEIDDMEKLARAFEEKQYLFIIPSFPQKPAHREVSDEIRLPFTKNEEIGAGNFGTTFSVNLPGATYIPRNQRARGNHEITLVRKQLKPGDGSVYKDELRVLRLLGLMEHPNIVEICGFYTYKKSHNFVLRWARDGDMERLLASRDRPTSFASDKAIYMALCGLASALHYLHFFNHTELNLKLIGCHRDLKPSNVLVDGTDFILADFGLTTMKDVSEGSKKTFEDRDPYYAAPESRDTQTLEKFEIGRKSDIWSLGCIITDLFAYMKGGPTGVEEYKEKRRSKVQGYGGIYRENKSFHKGRLQANEGVLAWFSQMEANATQGDRELLSLAKEMLEVDESKRLDIQEVLRRLRFATLKKYLESVTARFQKSRHHENLEFDIEVEIFNAWSSAIETDKDETLKILEVDATFHQILHIVSKILQELCVLDVAEDNYPLFTSLRRFNEELLAPFTKRIQSIISDNAETKILAKIDKDNKVVESKGKSRAQVSNLPESTTKASLLTVLSIKRMSDITQKSGDSSLILSKADINFANDVREVQTFQTGNLNLLDSDIPCNVLVEELKYGSQWQKEQIGQTLFERMQNVLRLPRDNPSITALDIRALSCKGFYHDGKHHSFGLVYEFPQENSTEINQLAELFDHKVTNFKDHSVISLEDRFKLAYDLANAVYKFHKVGWLHKNISSYNIVFFTNTTTNASTEDDPTTPPKKIRLTSPYLIGFSHSRPGGENQISNEVENQEHQLILQAYHHPKYLDINQPYQKYLPEYDYYSLGLVLLEIGYWLPLIDIVPEEESEKSRKDVLAYLRRRRVPFLAGMVGEYFMEAVEFCLSFGDKETKENIEMEFRVEVLDRLENCVIRNRDI